MRASGYSYLLGHAAILAALLLVLLAVGWFATAWLWCLTAYLAGLVIWHTRHLLALHAWLADPSGEPPSAWRLGGSGGIWGQSFEQLFRQRKRQHKKYRQLRRALEEYRNVTESFPEPIITMDDQSVVVWFNPASTQALGLRKPDDSGQPLGNILRNPDFVEWLEQGGSRPLDIDSPRDDNIKLNVRLFELSRRRRLLLFRDVTELRNVETVRRDFVANVSHELRTPLTVLIGYLESLTEDSSPELQLVIRRMHEQTRLMRNLIDDLIEISRLQGQLIRGRETSVDISALLAQLREQADSLNDKQHQIEFSNTAEVNLKGAENDLESAFSNLITNAIRYTPEGGRIQINWSLSEQGAVFSVSDNGIGIPHQDIPRLTERFYRVAKDRARVSGGSGLGLSIVKHVLNAHDAHLEIDSELGAGSVFRCVFPADRLIPVNIPRQPDNPPPQQSGKQSAPQRRSA